MALLCRIILYMAIIYSAEDLCLKFVSSVRAEVVAVATCEKSKTSKRLSRIIIITITYYIITPLIWY